MASFREMIGGTALIEAPVVFNPLSAKLAEAANFPALYLGGGGFGYIQCVTEANLTLTEMVRVGIDIRSVCRLPFILDGAAAGAIRCTCTEQSIWPKPPVSRRSRSRTSCCRSVHTIMSVSST
jgi:hypothetical protein